MRGQEERRGGKKSIFHFPFSICHCLICVLLDDNEGGKWKMTNGK